MIPEVPFTPMAKAYDDLLKIKGKEDGRGVLERRLVRVDEYLAAPAELAVKFEQSVAQGERFFAEHDQSTKPFFPKPRTLDRKPGLGNTAEVGALLESQPDHRWVVDQNDDLSFFYLEREIVVTQARGLRLHGGRSTRLGPRMDLLLANATDGTPVVCELKVTSIRGRPDKDPFFALTQALACASYLLPRNQLARLRHHDEGGHLESDLTRVDVYVLTVSQPERSRFWFDLRARAEHLGLALQPLLQEWVGRIVFLEFERPPAEHKVPQFPRLRVRPAANSRVSAVSGKSARL